MHSANTKLFFMVRILLFLLGAPQAKRNAHDLISAKSWALHTNNTSVRKTDDSAPQDCDSALHLLQRPSGNRTAAPIPASAKTPFPRGGLPAIAARY
jgi:hypothetical protein